MDAEAWQALQDQIEYARTIDALRKGLDEARTGKGMEAASFFEALASRQK